MIYTIENILSNPAFLNVVINRVAVTLGDADRIDWTQYLQPLATNPDGTFKSYEGVVNRVTIGSIIDKNSKKPIRKRTSMSKSYGEVANLGDSYQMDNDRLARLQELVDTLNRTGQQAEMEAIVNFLVDDFRQCYLAPNKTMDYMLNLLKFTGEAQLTSAQGVKINKIILPFKAGKNLLTPEAGVKDTFISYLDQIVPTLRANGVSATIMEMNSATFRKYIAGCAEFKTLVMKYGGWEQGVSTNLNSAARVNEVFRDIQLPFQVRIKDVNIAKEDGTVFSIPNKAISLLPEGFIGNLRHHRPYELVDQIPGKTYSEQGNDMFISTKRDEEGRYTEYGCDWIVDINRPNEMGLINLTNFA